MSSQKNSFLRKVVYLVAIAVLLMPLFWLSQPATNATKTAQGSPGGKLAQLGSRLIEGTAKGYAATFFERFKIEVEGPAAPVADADTGMLEGSTATEAVMQTTDDPQAVPAAAAVLPATLATAAPLLAVANSQGGQPSTACKPPTQCCSSPARRAAC